VHHVGNFVWSILYNVCNAHYLHFTELPGRENKTHLLNASY